MTNAANIQEPLFLFLSPVHFQAEADSEANVEQNYKTQEENRHT